MDVVICALALLSGMIGAGFASGREILRFFASHGAASSAAVLFACGGLYVLFLRLCRQMERCGAPSAGALCRARFGASFGRFSLFLFFLLSAITGGAMLAACAELAALVLPLRRAWGLGLAVSLLAGAAMALRGAGGLAAPGGALCLLLPVMFARLAALPPGESCFLPAMTPDIPVRAAADGLCYAALNAAMLLGALPMLMQMPAPRRVLAVRLFCLLFGLLLMAGAAVCLRHMPAVIRQPLPFVALGRRLGGGYLLLAACMYTAALSTLCAMLCAMMRMLPLPRAASLAVSCCVCLAPACVGFAPMVERVYPVLGAVCAGLLGLLCFAPAAAPPQ